MQATAARPEKLAACCRSAPRGSARSTCASWQPPTAIWKREIRAGRFSQDLFYRLCAATVVLPPLRERQRGSRCSPSTSSIAPAPAPSGRRCGWPTRRCQLLLNPRGRATCAARNLMDYAAVAVLQDEVRPEHLPGRIRSQSPHRFKHRCSRPPCTARPRVAPPSAADATSWPNIADEVAALEKKARAQALEHSDGNQRRAAALIGMPLRTFVSKKSRLACAPARGPPLRKTRTWMLPAAAQTSSASKDDAAVRRSRSRGRSAILSHAVVKRTSFAFPSCLRICRNPELFRKGNAHRAAACVMVRRRRTPEKLPKVPIWRCPSPSCSRPTRAAPAAFLSGGRSSADRLGFDRWGRKIEAAHPGSYQLARAIPKIAVLNGLSHFQRSPQNELIEEGDCRPPGQILPWSPLSVGPGGRTGS